MLSGFSIVSFFLFPIFVQTTLYKQFAVTLIFFLSSQPCITNVIVQIDKRLGKKHGCIFSCNILATCQRASKDQSNAAKELSPEFFIAYILFEENRKLTN